MGSIFFNQLSKVYHKDEVERSIVSLRTKNKSLGFIVFIILAGAMVGSALGVVIGLILPDGVVKDFFLRAIEGGLGPTTLDVILFTFTIGFTIKLNVIGIVGIVLVAYLLRWY